MAEPYLEITVPEPLIIGLEKINNDNHEQQAKIVDFPSKEEEDLDFIDRLAKKYGMSLDDSVFIRKYVFANVDTQLRFDQHWENTKIGNEPQKVLFKFDMAEPKVTDSTDAYLLCDVGTPKLTAMNKPEIDVFNRLYLIDFDDIL